MKRTCYSDEIKTLKFPVDMVSEDAYIIHGMSDAFLEGLSRSAVLKRSLSWYAKLDVATSYPPNADQVPLLGITLLVLTTFFKRKLLFSNIYLSFG